jgi:hypothetical protein
MYVPAQEMITTGPAYLDRDGVVVDSGEYVAALYESWAADIEWSQDDHNDVAGHYAHTAQDVAEELWTRDMHELA